MEWSEALIAFAREWHDILIWLRDIICNVTMWRCFDIALQVVSFHWLNSNQYFMQDLFNFRSLGIIHKWHPASRGKGGYWIVWHSVESCCRVQIMAIWSTTNVHKERYTKNFNVLYLDEKLILTNIFTL